MKKGLFLLPVLMLGLASCKSGGDTPTPTPTPTEPVLCAKLDFSSLTKTGEEMATAEALATDLKDCKTQGDATITYGAPTKVYNGNGTGGAKASTAGLIKMGTASANGVFKITADAEIKKVVLNCHSFYAKSESYPTNTTNFVAVNAGEAVATKAVAAPYNETAAGEDLTFSLETASKDVTIETYNPAPSGKTTAGRIYIYSISLYK